MKEQEELVKLGDRIRVSLLAKLTAMSDETGIARQQLTNDALALYVHEGDDAMARRQRFALEALKKVKAKSTSAVFAFTLHGKSNAPALTLQHSS